MATAGNTEEAEIRIKLSNGDEVGNTLRSLTTQSNKLKASINDLEPGTEAFINTSRDLKKVKTQYEAIDKEIKDVEEAQQSLNDIMMEYIPFAGQLQGFVKGYKQMNTVVEKTTFLTKVLGKTMATAFVATGIGLVIAALGLLVNWLSKAQVVTDFFGKALGALDGVINVLTSRLMKLISLDFKGAFSGLGDDLSNAAKKGWDTSEALQAITREEKQLELQRSKSRAEIERLKKLSEDTTKGLEVQAQAAKQASDLEQQLFTQQVAIESKKVKALQDRNAEAKRNGMLNDEMVNEAIDAEIKLNESKEESFGKQTELQNKLNELNRSASEEQKARMKEQADREKKDREDRLKAEQEYQQKILDGSNALKDARIALMTDDQEKRTAAALLAYERDMAAFKGTEDQKAAYALLRRQQLDMEIDAIEDENRKKAQEKALTDLQTAFDTKESKVNELFFQGVINEEQRNEQLYDLQVQALQDRLALLIANGSTETAEYQKIYTSLAELHFEHNKKKAESDKAYFDARNKLEDEALTATAEFFKSAADFLGRDEESRRKNFQTIKAMKIAELHVSSTNEIQKIWEYANANPLNAFFPGAGNVLAAIKTAAALMRLGTGISQINSAKFALGGPVFGPPHTAGGIPFRVRGSAARYEMEGNEIVLAKGVYQNPTLRAAASQLNVAGGGRSFAMGGPINPLASTPVTPSNPGKVVTTTNAPSASDPALVQEVRALREDIAGWNARLEVKLSLQKLREAEQRVRILEVDTTV